MQDNAYSKISVLLAHGFNVTDILKALRQIISKVDPRMFIVVRLEHAFTFIMLLNFCSKTCCYRP